MKTLLSPPRLSTLLALTALALPLAGCPADTGDETTNTTPAQTDTTEAATGNPTTTGDAPTTTTASPTTSTSDTADDTGPGETTTAPDDTSSTGVDTTTGAGLSFAADIYPNIIQAHCSCHVNGGSGGLAMPDAATAHTNLVGVPAGQAALDRVEPGDHEASYVWHKITGTQAEVGGSGGQMPKGGPPLAQGDIDLIAQWIDEGANP